MPAHSCYAEIMSLHPTPSHPSVDAQHARLMRLATTASISVAMLLVAAKFIVWWMSDSLAMLSSLTDSLFDIATSLINFIAVRYAQVGRQSVWL